MKILLLLFLFLFLFLISFSLKAEDSWKEINTKAKLEVKAGRLDAAFTLHEHALALAKKNDKSHIVASLLNLGAVYEMQKNYKQAEKFYQLALETLLKQYGKHTSFSALALDCLAHLNEKLGKYQESLELSKQVESIYFKQLGKDSPYWINSARELAWKYTNQKNFKEAEVLLQKLIALYESDGKQESIEFINILSDLAAVYNMQESYFKAEEIYKRAFKLIPEKNSRLLANYYNKFGRLYIKIGDYELAEKLLLKAININKNLKEPNYSEIVKELDSLADINRSASKYENAYKLYQQELSIYEQHLKEDLVGIALLYLEIGDLFFTQGEPVTADSYISKALKVFKDIPLDDKTTTTQLIKSKLYSSLGYLYCEQKNYKNANEYLNNALKITQDVYGAHHSIVVGKLNNLAMCYFKQNLFEQSESNFLQAINIVKQELGEEHPRLGIYYTNLAELYYKQKFYNKALQFFKMALNIKRKNFSSNHKAINYLKFRIKTVYIKESFSFFMSKKSESKV